MIYDLCTRSKELNTDVLSREQLATLNVLVYREQDLFITCSPLVGITWTLLYSADQQKKCTTGMT